MEMKGQLTTVASVLSYMMAGNATLSIRSVQTGKHFTYKVQAPKDVKPGQPKPFFVKVLDGPDNTSQYAYIGLLKDGFKHTKKSKCSDKAPSFVAFSWLWSQLAKNQLPATVEVWHEGKCGRCGRKLTVPESVALGIGPECAGKMGIA